jgi:hypothetical protein
MWAQIEFKEDAEDEYINPYETHNPDTVWQLKYPRE